MNIDQFHHRTYDSNNYNCAHFVCEVWEHITGDNINLIMEGFLLPPKDRFVRYDIFKQFEKLINPKSPCIVLMQGGGVETHVGLYCEGKVLQIKEQGVDYQPIDVATFGFNKIGFYTC